MLQDAQYAITTRHVRDWTGGLFIVSGLIHGIIMPEYLNLWWGYGSFFFVAAIAQVIFGFVILMQPWRYDEMGHIRSRPENFALPVYCAGALGNAALVGLYLVTRIVGIPFLGPEVGHVQPFTGISLFTQGIEVLLIVMLLVMIRRTLHETE
jgi:hypothetical protein